MKFVGILLAFFGYLLVYASVAAGGKFAAEPWAGMFTDAYAPAKQPAQSPSQPQAPSPVRPRAPRTPQSPPPILGH